MESNTLREQLLPKLRQLNATQQSIESVSSWCIFYHKEAKTIVAAWDEEFSRTGAVEKKLALLYLANHIMQESKKRGKEFTEEYSRYLAKSIKDIYRLADGRTRNSVSRLVKIWEERRVFGSSLTKQLRDTIAKVDAAPRTSTAAAAMSESDKKKLQVNPFGYESYRMDKGNFACWPCFGSRSSFWLSQCLPCARE